jgi:hypothetical protein
MEWVGFIALLFIGGYALAGGVVLMIASNGFTGRVDPFAYLMALAGAGVLWAAWAFKPFEIIIQ